MSVVVLQFMNLICSVILEKMAIFVVCVGKVVVIVFVTQCRVCK